jgi:hypothetical protein
MKYLDDYEKAQRIKRYAAACKKNMLRRPIVALKLNNNKELVWK